MLRSICEKWGTKKPVVALVAGRHVPTRRRMGHAGVLTMRGRADATSKIEALKSVGVTIVSSAHLVGTAMREAMKHAGK